MTTGHTDNWGLVQFAVTVPNKNCIAQTLQLDLDARMASERFITGSIQYADLHIARTPRSDYGLETITNENARGR
jgi:hypothetical protein